MGDHVQQTALLGDREHQQDQLDHVHDCHQDLQYGDEYQQDQLGHEHDRHQDQFVHGHDCHLVELRDYDLVHPKRYVGGLLEVY